MPPRRWLISAAIAFYLAAITLAALPEPSDLQIIGPARHPAGNTASSVMTPVLDSVAREVYGLEALLYRIFDPLRPVTDLYSSLGVNQRWAMFANPSPDESYMRIDHVLGERGSVIPSLVHREVVYPVMPEQEIRILHPFRDKAIFTAGERYFMNQTKILDRKGVNSGERPTDFAPMARHFSKVFRETNLRPGEKLLRTEVWWGIAPIAEPGEQLAEDVVARRWRVLARYRDPSARERIGNSLKYWIGASTREADIVWMLADVKEEP